jgi:hypothetical protein
MPRDKAVSAIIRAAGQTIERIGKEIEASQIEDGDPPYLIPKASLHALQNAVSDVQRAFWDLGDEGDIHTE